MGNTTDAAEAAGDQTIDSYPGIAWAVGDYADFLELYAGLGWALGATSVVSADATVITYAGLSWTSGNQTNIAASSSIYGKIGMAWALGDQAYLWMPGPMPERSYLIAHENRLMVEPGYYAYSMPINNRELLVTEYRSTGLTEDCRSSKP
jgi:hypothetical protein